MVGVEKENKTFSIIRRWRLGLLVQTSSLGKVTAELELEYPSRTLVHKKNESEQIIKVHGLTFTLDVKRLHHTVSINKINLLSDARGTSEATTQVESSAKIDDQLFVGDE